jgi:membrane-bound ClpP family serine protease
MVRASTTTEPEGDSLMIALGLILLILGLVIGGLHVLFVIGIILLIIGLVLAALGAAGRQVGGRKHWY